MKILRVVHGLANNVVDVEVPDGFNIALWGKELRADGCFCNQQFWINTQWVQNAFLLTPEQVAEMSAQNAVSGMTKQ